MFRFGRAVAAAIEAARAGADSPFSDVPIQPGCVEHTVERVLEQQSPGRTSRDGEALRGRARTRRRQLVGGERPVRRRPDDG